MKIIPRQLMLNMRNKIACISIVCITGCGVYESDEIYTKANAFYQENNDILKEVVSFTKDVQTVNDSFSIVYYGKQIPSLRAEYYENGADFENDFEVNEKFTDFFRDNQIRMSFIRDSIVKFVIPSIRNRKYVSCKLAYFFDSTLLQQSEINGIKIIDSSITNTMEPYIFKINSNWALISPSSY